MAETSFYSPIPALRRRRSRCVPLLGATISFSDLLGDRDERPCPGCDYAQLQNHRSV